MRVRRLFRNTCESFPKQVCEILANSFLATHQKIDWSLAFPLPDSEEELTSYEMVAW